jgi:NitT/TauT family transport system ATP-binding protein
VTDNYDTSKFNYMKYQSKSDQYPGTQTDVSSLTNNIENISNKSVQNDSFPLLELRNISKEFIHSNNNHKRAKVLNNINLFVSHNEFISIVGPSGCGKSTLLRIIMGLEKYTDGEILFKGQSIKSNGIVNPYMAIVFQSFGLFPWLTVAENVEFGLESMHIPKTQRREKSLRIIQDVGLEGFEDAYPRELSGGMKQRVGIARALVMDPEILIMDEPFSSLDPLTAEALREEILKVWSNKLVTPEVVIMVTHNIEEAVYLSDRVIILSHRPGTVLKEVNIQIPRSREKRDKSIYEYSNYITTMIS